MSAKPIPGPFSVERWGDEFRISNEQGVLMAVIEPDFDMEAREFVNHAEAEARAEQICAALNLLDYVTDAKGGST